MADHKFTPAVPLFEAFFLEFKRIAPVDVDDDLREFVHMAMVDIGMVKAIEEAAVAAYLAAHHAGPQVPAEQKPSGGKKLNCWQLYVQVQMPLLAKDPVHKDMKHEDRLKKLGADWKATSKEEQDQWRARAALTGPAGPHVKQPLNDWQHYVQVHMPAVKVRKDLPVGVSPMQYIANMWKELGPAGKKAWGLANPA